MRKLDLRTGMPVWKAYRAGARLDEVPLSKDVKADVIIIGMGISGAMAADLLTERGLDVVMIDRRGPSEGSTPATTALVQYEIDTPLSKLSLTFGAEKSRRAWRRSRLAVANLRDRISSLGIACHMTGRETLYLAGNVLGPGALRKEADLRNASGLACRYLTRGDLNEMFGLDRAGAILSGGNLVLDPIRLTAGLLRAAAARGARFFAPEEAVDVENGRDDVTVRTAGGYTVTARYAVLATGYELLDVVRDRRHRIVSTWAMATSRRPSSELWPREAMIWEASDPYLYMRTTHDGRVICGGEDEEFEDEDLRDAKLPAKTRRIAQKLRKLFPQLDTTPEYAWTASFGSTSNGLPLIGPLPRKPRLFAVMGYGGNGITFSRIAAESVVSHICADGDDDRDLFAY